MKALVKKDKRWVLLVHEEGTVCQTIENTLRDQGLEIRHAHTCSDVVAALQGPGSPELILIRATPTGGIWEDVLNLTQTLDPAISVVVLGPSESR